MRCATPDTQASPRGHYTQPGAAHGPRALWGTTLGLACEPAHSAVRGFTAPAVVGGHDGFVAAVGGFAARWEDGMYKGTLASLLTLVIWVGIGSALAAARPTPPASLFGRAAGIEQPASPLSEMACDPARC